MTLTKWQVLWGLWLIAGIVLEVVTVLNQVPNDTLSSQVWRLTSNRVGWWLVLIFLVWLAFHWLVEPKLCESSSLPEMTLHSEQPTDRLETSGHGALIDEESSHGPRSQKAYSIGDRCHFLPCPQQSCRTTRPQT